MINPTDCKPDQAYVVRVDSICIRGREVVAQRIDAGRGDDIPWCAITEWGEEAWFTDGEVTVLYRLVPAQDENAMTSVWSEADEIDRLADEIEQITDDAGAPVSAASLREMAAEQRADDAAQASEDELVEKVARVIAAEDGVFCAGLERARLHRLARAALAAFRAEGA